MKNLVVTCFAVVLAGVSAFAFAAEKPADLNGAKCFISGKPAVATASADYKGGKVYFCCPGCPGAFKKDTAKFAVKANHQLVLTSQAVQKGCPLNGKKVNPSTAIEVAGTKVAFCCNNCKGKAEGSGDVVNFIFNDATFEKAFKVGSKEK